MLICGTLQSWKSPLSSALYAKRSVHMWLAIAGHEAMTVRPTRHPPS